MGVSRDRCRGKHRQNLAARIASQVRVSCCPDKCQAWVKLGTCACKALKWLMTAWYVMWHFLTSDRHSAPKGSGKQGKSLSQNLAIMSEYCYRFIAKLVQSGLSGRVWPA